jgi:hypothetical protein
MIRNPFPFAAAIVIAALARLLADLLSAAGRRIAPLTGLSNGTGAEIRRPSRLKHARSDDAEVTPRARRHGIPRIRPPPRPGSLFSAPPGMPITWD